MTLTLCGLTLIGNSQNTSLEQSTFGIQTGLLGVWAHNETKISDEIALRTELGLNFAYINSDFFDVKGYALAPAITLEPRWYYNLNKRESKSRRIDGNSGNFISLKTTYHPDWFKFSNNENINITSDISIIPTWGIRINIGSHFTYETGLGVGYVRYLKTKNTALVNPDDVAVNLHLRIGYRF